MSSSTSSFDHGDTRADRRILAAGETNGDGKSTTTSPTLLRFDWWQKQDPTLTGPSTTTTMAGTTAQPRYAGDTSAVEVKHLAQKGSAPHPEHD